MGRDDVRGYGLLLGLSVIVVAGSAIAGGGGPTCLDESFSQACDWASQPASEECPHLILINGDCYKVALAASGFDTKQGSSVLCRYQAYRPILGGGCEENGPVIDYNAACDRAVGKVCTPPEPPNP